MTQVKVGQVVDVTVTCRTFPRLPANLVDRMHLLETIEAMFAGDTTLVTLEGEQGIGKTVLLSQFARRHAHDTVALFLRPTNRLAYDPAFLRRDLCNQLLWLVSGKELDDTQNTNDADLASLWHALQGKASREHRVLYFILDGLDDIPEADAQLREAFLDLPPFALASFRFLLTADLRRLPDKIKSAMDCRSYLVPRFSLDECVRFFRELVPNQNDVMEFRTICDGIPERLASISRLLKSGTALDDLRRDMPNQLAQLFEFEWRPVAQSSDSHLQLMLAIIAHERARHTLSDVARLAGLSANNATSLLEPLRFIQIGSDSDEVSSVSPAFREFAAQRLWQQKSQVTEIIISDLSRVPESDESLAQLPAYFAEARRHDQLFRYLTPSRFVSMVESHQSLLPAFVNVDLGVHQACQLHRDVELAQLAAQSALLREFGKVGAARAEIEALMALELDSKALALVQWTMLKEDRLQLLAIIAKVQKRRDGSSLDQIVEEIQRLFDQVDCARLGKRALEIAADLIHVQPDLAIRMVEDAHSTIHGDTSLAWAYAHLSLEALLAQNESEGPSTDEDLLKRLNAHIKDPRARRLTYALTNVAVGQTARDVLDSLYGIDTARDKIMSLRSWTVINRERPDAIEVVDHAFKYLLTQVEIAPSAAVFRDFAEPLPYVENREAARRMVGAFDSQKDLIERQGPSQDYVRVQLTLLQTECRYDHVGAQNRLVELFAYLESLTDLTVRAECHSWLVASFDALRERCISAGMPMIVTQAEENSCNLELDRLLDDLLIGTAEHYYATIGAIQALSTSRPNDAVALGQKLNTQVRRDAAQYRVIETLLTHQEISKLGHFLDQAIGAISDHDMHDEAVVSVLERLVEPFNFTSTTAFDLNSVLPIINQSTSVASARERCRACCLSLRALAIHRKGFNSSEPGSGQSIVLSERSDTDDYVDHLTALLTSTIETSWNAIDVGWLKVEAGYQIAGWLATIDRPLAQKYANMAEQTQRALNLNVEGAALTFVMSLSLAIRAFGGTPHQYDELEHDVSHLGHLIDAIPSAGERAAKWSDLALRCLATRRQELGKQIVREHVVPLLRELSEDDRAYRDIVIGAVAPSLYAVHHSMAKSWIEQLARPARDHAYARVAQYILTGLPPGEPLDEQTRSRNDVSDEELLDLCDLVDAMEEDTTLCWTVHQIALAVQAGRRYGHPGQPTRQQIREVATRLQNIIEQRLPQPGNISHDGYRILASADIIRIDPGFPSKEQRLKSLVEQTNAIPNTADRAHVLIGLIEYQPSTALRNPIIEAVESAIQGIPSLSERSSRYLQMAGMLLSIDLPTDRSKDERHKNPDQRVEQAKRLLRQAMESSAQVNDGSVNETQRHIIDLAYGIDQQFADSLATLADDDPARLSRRILALEIKSKIKSFASPRPAVTNAELPQTLASRLHEDPAIAWSLLGALHAGRITPVHAEWLRESLESAATLPLEQAYPILAWVTQNAIARYGQSDQSQTYVLPFFHGLLAASDLCLRLAGYAYGRTQRSTWSEATANETFNEGLVRVGERSHALIAVRDWVNAHVERTLVIWDPYFGPDELEWLHLVASVKPDCQVTIVTSRHAQRKAGLSEPYAESYRIAWRRLSDQPPPETDIVVIGTHSKGEPPIHDRWFLADHTALIVGTSLNSLGISKDSKLTPVEGKTAIEIQQRVEDYLSRRVRTHRGERLDVVRFTLN